MKTKIFDIFAFFWYPLCFLFWLVIKLNYPGTYTDLAFIASLVLFVFYIIYFIRMVVSDVNENVLAMGERVKIYVGAPGCGKTSKGLHLAVKLANQNWNYIKSRYKYYQRRLKLFNKKPIKFKKQLEDYQEIKQSYEFWQKNKEYIPCLITNIPLKQGKKYSYILTKDHILQKEAVPYRSVLFVDEIGTWFSQLQSTDKSLERLQLSDFVRLIRHFVDGHLLATEQDSGSIDIEVRRRVATNTAMYSQRWKFESIVFRFLSTFAEKFLPYSVENFIKQIYMRIGFRKYEYLNESNTERTVNVNLNNEETEYNVYITPALLNYQYDSRTFKNAYLAKGKVFNLAKWDKLVPTVDQLRNLGYFDHYAKMLQSIRK